MGWEHEHIFIEASRQKLLEGAIECCSKHLLSLERNTTSLLADEGKNDFTIHSLLEDKRYITLLSCAAV